MRLTTLAIAALLACLSTTVDADEKAFPAFKEVVLDPHVGEVCYAVTAADVDGDGKQDVIAVTENRVLWYQAPGWKKRVIIEDQTERDNVCIEPFDIDGDGKVDFALGAGWTKVGTIQWLSRGKSLDDKWHVHKIAEEPWLHRMRFADVLGTGRPQLVVSPLNKTVGNGVRMTAFSIPKNPTKDRWEPNVMDDVLNKMHNHWHVDFNRDGRIDTITASEEGLHVIERDGDGWKKTQIGGEGAGEIKTGKLKSGDMFLVAIEPMHGTHVVVFTRPKDDDFWIRHGQANNLVRGHALWTADLDGDGDDEIIVGHSNSKAGDALPRGVYVFDCVDGTGAKWEKHVIDEGGVAVEDAVAADLTGDGRIDIVAGGRYTHNLKLYVNQGSAGK